MIKFIRVFELTIRIQGRIHKNIVNAFLKCDGILILWKKHYSKMVPAEGYKYNQHCREIFMISLIVMDVFDYAVFFTLNDYNKNH